MTIESIDAPGIPARAVVSLPRKIVLLDVAERAVVAAVFAHFAYRMGVQFEASDKLRTLLIVLAETLPFVYVMARGWSATLSQKPADWALGILGTTAPLMVTPVSDAEPLLPAALCAAIMIAGLCLQIAAKLALGRSFGIIAANRGVKSVGPYRLLRHPMYAGYTLTHIGFLLAMPALINLCFYGLALSLQIARIFREERVLMADPGYRAFAQRVRFRLLPGVF